MKKKILSFITVIILVVSNYAWSQVEEDVVKYDLGKIIVSATKTPAYQAEIGSSTTVITAEDIRKTGKRTVLEVLQNVPSLTVMQNSAFGGPTSVYLRGAKPGHTLVLIDGVEVNDPMGIDRAFDFAHLTTDNIERIEIVRGPQSPLYGSDAIAGVINIITKKGVGKTKISSYLEAGSYNTWKESLDLSGSKDKFNYSLSLLRLDSDGISKAAGGTENDPYKNTTISSKIGYNFGNSELSLTSHFTDAVTSIDDDSYEDDPNYTAWLKEISSKLEFEQSINSLWSHSLSFSYHDVHRKYRDEKDDIDTTEDVQSWYKGDNKKIEWQHNFSPFEWSKITGGFEYEEERGSSYYRSGTYISKFDRKTVGNYAFYLQNQFKFQNKLFITPGLRIDDHELFGTETTYKISTAYLIPQIGTQLKGNYGTGFKAPSLFQLYSSYGDPNLKPDESRSYDFGFEQKFIDNKISFGLSYFHNDFKNMVAWDSATSKYKNIENAETNGFELETKFLPLKSLTIGANFTYTDTKDKETGLELVRRPKRQVNLNLNWQFLENANINLGLNYVGKRKDTDYTSWPYERITMKDYAKVDISCSYDLTKDFQIFGRIENLFDKNYQEIYGYSMPRRSFYAGIKASF